MYYSSCLCPVVNINCEKDVQAEWDPNYPACKLTLDSDNCEALGLDGVDEILPEDLEYMAALLFMEAPANIDSAQALCTLAHEIIHINDPTSRCPTDTSPNGNCDEERAFELSLECISDVVRDFCSNSSSEECQSLRWSKLQEEVALNINRCYCRNGRNAKALCLELCRVTARSGGFADPNQTLGSLAGVFNLCSFFAEKYSG